MNEKILIIEDEEDLVKGIMLNLVDENYEVIYALDGNTGYKMALEEKPDLILLDIMMPGINGLEVCQKLRQEDVGIPILMLTAKGGEIDKVVGLEIGADDYISKPFSIRELIARIKAHLRRTNRNQEEYQQNVRVGEAIVDFDHLIVSKNNVEVELTFMEAEILKYLVSKKGKVVSRDDLLDKVWGYDKYPTTRTIDNHILKLRKKIEDHPNHPKYILTVYGGGYRILTE